MTIDRMSDQPAFAGISTFLGVPQISAKDLQPASDPAAGRFRKESQGEAAASPGRRIHHLGLRVEPMKLLRVFDYGDADVVPGDIERTNQSIKAKVAEIAQARAIPLILGGDHSITYPSESGGFAR